MLVNDSCTCSGVRTGIKNRGWKVPDFPGLATLIKEVCQERKYVEAIVSDK
jgi:hypothetical protein